MAEVTERNEPTYDLTGLTREEMLTIATLIGQLMTEPQNAGLWEAMENLFDMSELPPVLVKQFGQDAVEAQMLVLEWG